MSHGTIVMDVQSLPGIIHSDNSDALSRLAVSRMHTLNMTTAAPLPQTRWEISGFQRFHKEYGCRNQIEGHPLTYYRWWLHLLLAFMKFS